MPSFRYRARDRQGALVTGTLEAEDRAGLEISLDKMGLIPISIVSGRKSSGPLLKSIFRPHKVSTPEIILFSRQPATLSGAGVPLTRALHSIERQLANPFFTGTVREIREDIEGGGVLSSAIKKHPRVFPELYSSMVEGEAAASSTISLSSPHARKGSEQVQGQVGHPLPEDSGRAIVAAVVISCTSLSRGSHMIFQNDAPLPTRYSSPPRVPLVHSRF